MKNFHSGKEAGTTFEKIFERQCLLAGLWADPNNIKARRGWGGRLQELKSNLDYTVIGYGARTAFVDCKTWDSAYFTFSDIPLHQLSLAVRYNSYGIHAGFVVWFRPINRVSFFSGNSIAQRGAGNRFVPKDGFPLGSWECFSPELIFRSPSGSATVTVL